MHLLLELSGRTGDAIVNLKKSHRERHVPGLELQAPRGLVLAYEGESNSVFEQQQLYDVVQASVSTIHQLLRGDSS